MFAHIPIYISPSPALARRNCIAIFLITSFVPVSRAYKTSYSYNTYTQCKKGYCPQGSAQNNNDARRRNHCSLSCRSMKNIRTKAKEISCHSSWSRIADIFFHTRTLYSRARFDHRLQQTTRAYIPKQWCAHSWRGSRPRRDRITG